MDQNYSLEELEKQYSPSVWVTSYKPETVGEDSMAFVVCESEKVTANIPDVIQLKYGETAEQRIDIFGDTSLPADAPVFVFIHGGYWIFGSIEESRFFVQPYYDAGIVCGPLGYDIVDENNSLTLPDLIQQVNKGICTVLKYAKRRGSRGVYLCGHSAGAHLVMAALSTETKTDYDIIKAVVPVSGLFDLNTLLKTQNAPAARITAEIAGSCSPLFDVGKLKQNLPDGCKILVIVAEHDSKCFIQHSEVYAKALQDAGMNCVYKFVKGEDHYSIITRLVEPTFVVNREIMQLMEISNSG